MILSCLPQFMAKTEKADAPLPRSFRLCYLCYLAEFARDLEEGSLLCPVQALRAYLDCTKSFPLRASTLFCSPRSVSCDVEERCLILLAGGHFGCWGCWELKALLSGLSAFVVSPLLLCV